MIEVTGTYHLNSIGYFFMTHTYEIMLPILVLLVFLFIINFKTIKKYFSKVDKKTWIILVFIFLLGFWLRNAGYTYGAFVDGFFYQEAAKTIYEKNLFLKGCAIGSLEDCRLYHEVLWPQGYPFLITLSFHIFGEHDLIAMYISGILGSLTILLVFGIAYLLFSSEKIGLCSAMIYTFIPLDIFLCSTATVRPTSSFFLALTIFFFILALRKNSVKLWSLVAIAFSYAIFVRQENVVLLLPLLFLFLYKKGGELKSFNGIKKNLKILFIPFVIFLVTQIPAQHWVLFSDTLINYGRDPQFSLHYLVRNVDFILSNLFSQKTFIQQYLFIPWISFFSFLSVFVIVFCFLKKKETKNKIFLWLIFVVFFLITALFFDPVGNSVRRLQSLFLPYSILASFSLLFFTDKIKKFRKYSLVFIFCALLLSALFFGISFKPYIFKDDRMKENLTRNLVEAINSTPKNSLIFISQTTTPDFDLIERGRRFVDIDLIPADHYRFVEEEMEYSKHRPMYFIEDYRCGHVKDEGQCDFIYKNFEFLNSTKIDDIKLYRITYLRE